MILFEKMMVLNNVPLFTQLSTNDLQLLAEIAYETKLSEKDVVFKADELGGQLYIIVSGQIELKLFEKVLATLSTHQFLGEMSLFDESIHHTSALCLTDCHLLILDHDDLEPLLYKQPAMAIALLKSFSQQLRNLTYPQQNNG